MKWNWMCSQQLLHIANISIITKLSGNKLKNKCLCVAEKNTQSVPQIYSQTHHCKASICLAEMQFCKLHYFFCVSFVEAFQACPCPGNQCKWSISPAHSQFQFLKSKVLICCRGGLHALGVTRTGGSRQTNCSLHLPGRPQTL